MELFSSPGNATYNRGAFLKEPVQFFNLKLPPSLFARHDRFYIFTHQAIEACIAIDSNLLGTLSFKNGRREVDRIAALQPWVTLTRRSPSVSAPARGAAPYA